MHIKLSSVHIPRIILKLYEGGKTDYKANLIWNILGKLHAAYCTDHGERYPVMCSCTVVEEKEREEKEDTGQQIRSAYDTSHLIIREQTTVILNLYLSVDTLNWV